jgi:hypothetical protein
VDDINKNLTKVTEELKRIASIMGVSVGINPNSKSAKVRSTLTKEELSKVRQTAEETAKTYKTVLGLGYNQKDVDKTADRFRIKLGILPFFTTMKGSFDSFKTLLQSSLGNSTRSNLVQQEMLNDLRDYFNNKQQFSSSLMDEVANLNNTAFHIYDKINSDKTNADLITELQSLGVSIQPNPSKDYEPILTSIQATMNSVLTAVNTKFYEPLIMSIDATMKDIKSGFSSLATRMRPTVADTSRKIRLLKTMLSWDSFKDSILRYLTDASATSGYVSRNIEQLVRINDDIREQNRKKSSSTSLPSSGSILDKLKNIAGLMAIGGAMFLIISALIKAGMINTMTIIKVLGILSVFVGMFVLIGKSKSSLYDASKGFGLLSATILLLIIPMFYALNKVGLFLIAEGLLKMSAIVVACIGLMKVMSLVSGPRVISSSKGLAMLAGVLGLIVIPLFYLITKLNYLKIMEGIVKMIPIFLACWGMVKAMSMIDAKNVIKNSTGLAILSAVFSFLLIPMFNKLSSINYETILNGLGKFGLAVGGLLGIVGLIGKIVEKFQREMIVGTATIVGLSLTLGLIGYMLEGLSNKDWDKINDGILSATVALTSFGIVVGVIGAIALEVAPFLLAGAGTFLLLSFTMGMIADAVNKFNTIDGNKIGEVGKGLAILSGGLLAFIGGTVAGLGAGILNGLTSFFGLDPASQIKEFEKINADKIEKLGLGLSNMAQGLKSLSSGIDLSNVTKQITDMIRPLASLTEGLDKFSGAYERLTKTKIQTEYKINVETDNSIQKAIMSLNEQELAVQKLQLAQLQQNGEYLRVISERIRSEGSQVLPMQGQNLNNGYTSPNITTKDNFLNNIKLATMSFS